MVPCYGEAVRVRRVISRITAYQWQVEEKSKVLIEEQSLNTIKKSILFTPSVSPIGISLHEDDILHEY